MENGCRDALVIWGNIIHATKTGDTKEIKNALKVYIDTLIDLYKLL